MSNLFRTALLLLAMTALLVVVGGLLGGRGGVAIALVFALCTNVFAYWNSDRLALAASGARPVSRAEAPDIVALVAELASRAGLPEPRTCVVDSAQPNAFATGRDPAHAAVVLNTGLLTRLARDELAGVVAHELAHIRNRDTLTMTVTATLAGAITGLAQWGWMFGDRRDRAGGIGSGILVALLAPVGATLVQMAVSRSREYEADRVGAAICGNPLALASALAKIAGEPLPDPVAEAHPAMAHLYIVNPLRTFGVDRLFSTHPDVHKRIAALQRLAQDMRPAHAPDRGWAPFRQPEEAGFLGGRGIGPVSGGVKTNPNKTGHRGPWG